MSNLNQSTMRALALLALAIAIILGGYFYQNSRQAASVTLDTAASSTDGMFSAVAPGQDTTRGTTNIIPITAEATYKSPAYPKTLSFSIKLSDSEKSTIQKAYGVVVGDLTEDRYDFNAWINLGTLNLMAGNYKAAETIWQFASTQWPTNQASHNNLGDLYMNYLKDYPKAETEYLAGIKNKPGDPNPYKNLFTMYSDTSYKPTNTAAEDILRKGITAVPTSVDLKYMLAVWYKKLGRTQEATAQFQTAINEANKQGLTQVAAQIKTDAGIK
ncbi:MAG: hypothetical protein KBD06_00840 [Candidatus Pacebacteria bacterium]|nr:hypothetical protein [Candidatus Paceibacterota bacterium]